MAVEAGRDHRDEGGLPHGVERDLHALAHCLRWILGRALGDESLMGLAAPARGRVGERHHRGLLRSVSRRYDSQSRRDRRTASLLRATWVVMSSAVPPLPPTGLCQTTANVSVRPLSTHLSATAWKRPR